MRCLAGLLCLLLGACSAPVSKPDALDLVALGKHREHLLSEASLELDPPGPKWLHGIDPHVNLTFARLRGDISGYVLLLDLDPATDRLVLWPLPPGETPLDNLNDPVRRRQLQGMVAAPEPPKDALELSLADLLAEQAFDLPLPQPRQVFAVAANYPSHLSGDLAQKMDEERIGRLQAARPRIFVKFPPVAPPGRQWQIPGEYLHVQGPFATLDPPPRVVLPAEGGGEEEVIGHLDYEAEIAAVIGRRLTWEEARAMSDAELGATVVGYVLFSDAKLRDPQVMGRIVRIMAGREPAAGNSYRVGDEALDAALGGWDGEVCQWWSYAGSWGRYASAGPFLVAAPDDGSFPDRLLLAGRSYAAGEVRGAPLPEGVDPGPWLLRQSALTSVRQTAADRLIWDLPVILRSLLDPAGNALSFYAKRPVLEAGDLVSLGTPGGTVITAKPGWLLKFAEKLLFWSDPDDFYRRFFAEARGYYLHPGDRVLLWADGLGYQLLDVAD